MCLQCFGVLMRHRDVLWHVKIAILKVSLRVHFGNLSSPVLNAGDRSVTHNEILWIFPFSASSMTDHSGGSIFSCLNQKNSGCGHMAWWLVEAGLRLFDISSYCWCSSCWLVKFEYLTSLFMVALCNRADHIYFHHVVCSFFFLFFSSPNLSGRRLDVCHTSTHGVALVRI